jgi:hypothetical protein
LALFSRVAEWTVVLTLFQAGMIGVRWRLLLNPPEASFSHTAKVFFAAAILSLGFSAFLK